MPDVSTTSGLTQITTVAAPAPDQQRALEFYTETLGFELRLDAEFGPGMRWIEVAAPGAATSIALAPVPPGGETAVDTGIRIGTYDADETHAHLLAHGVDVDAEIMRWPNVPPMFTMRDSEGNKLYVVQCG